MTSGFRSLFLILSLLLSSFATTQAWGEMTGICRYCGRDHSAAAKAPAASPDRKYAPDRLVDLLHLKIDVTPDYVARTVAGVTTLTFAPISKPVEEVTLNAERLDVSSIVASLPLADTVVTDHHLTLLFAQPIAVGQKVEVTITYTAQPQKGLYFRTAELGYPAGDTHLWTQGETHEAPHWFPCFDYPNERSSTEVICTVPTGMTVLSNGKPMEVAQRAPGTTTVRWLQQKPHACYLVCLAAGYFHKIEDKHRDVPLRFFTQPSLAEHAENAFVDTRTIMAFYESEIGLPFPWDKYDQATALDFTSGGMENTSLTMLMDSTVNSKETENIYSSRNLDAHEMAHQWFGDYVTCEDWSHLWLNEGFATYYTHLYNEHKLGRDHLLYGLWQDATEDVLPEGDDPRPIVYRGYHNAWEQFDFRAYPKGSWVLHMLRSQLGEDLYRQSIQNYLEEHALSSVVTADLIDAFENASGKELDKFFDQWVYHAGNPVLKISHKWHPKEKLAQVTIEQTQETNDNVLLFEFPALLRFEVDGQAVDHPVTIGSKKQEFYIPLDKQPTLVRFDPEYTVLTKVKFDKPQKMFLHQLSQSGDLIGRLLAVESLSKKENHQSIAALKKSLNNDPFYGVRVEAARALRKMGTDEAFDALSDSLTQPDARVRLRVVQNIGKFYRPESLKILTGVIDNEANPAITAAAILALGKYPTDDARGRIEVALRTESFRNRIAAAAIVALGDSGDTALRGQLLRLLKNNQRTIDARSYTQGLKVLAKLWRDADDKTPARSWLETCLADPAGRVRIGAIEALGELGDTQAIALLQSYAEIEANSRGEKAAKEAIEKLEQQAPFVPSEVRQLRTTVSDLKKEQKKLRKEVDTLRAKAKASVPKG